MDADNMTPDLHWPGDVLDRKCYADFLSSYLVAKVKRGDGKVSKSFTLALDAQWGFGKTFFVTHWANDLSNAVPAYPTLVFDAWSADYADDPMVAFMATFKSALDRRIDQAGLTAKLKKKATENVAAAVHGLRRAILPAGKQIVKGLLHRATGIAAEEVLAAYKGATDAAVEALSDEELAKSGLDIMNKGLDKFFDKALEEQVERQKAIHEFRDAIERTLQTLVEHAAISLPMFVFIDEVDRCRPSFAIALLEGIKHLFGVPGVCFVVSTNMSQLSESMKAIYGPGFDGHGYLKRFFDVEYSLPMVSGHDFTELLLTEYPELMTYDMALGLPHRGFVSPVGKPMSACYALTWVAEVFGLDLRSQRKVFEMISASAAGVPKGKKVFLLWLATLCAIKHKSSDAFEVLAKSRDNSGEFHDLWDKVVVADIPKQFIMPQSHGGDTRSVALRDVAWEYYGCMYLDLKEIRNHRSDLNIYDYPAAVIISVIEEMPNSYFPDNIYPPSIGTYFHLVRTAGHLVAF